jgi:serine/threonine protein phosphatase 1
MTVHQDIIPSLWRRVLGITPEPDARGLPAGERVYAVGDIHGQARLLRELIDLIAADIAARPVPLPRLIFLGDYVDRGVGTADVIEALSNGPLPGVPTECLMGNHEDIMLRALDDDALYEQWMRLGGLETLVSYGVPLFSRSGGPASGEERMAALRKRLPAHHHAFLRALKPCTRRSGYFFAHAGVRPGVALDRQDRNDLLTIRKDFHKYRQPLGAVVVHGHTPVREPEILENRINIDTGAYATGRLTAAVLEGEEVRLIVADKMGCM